ncbi:hypothetical protein C8R44DRAFT_726470 [Mycena epipterygia]|nr:hypothetical protein C8R44DRAFT_726470 [Mycena epipterygia]
MAVPQAAGAGASVVRDLCFDAYDVRCFWVLPLTASSNLGWGRQHNHRIEGGRERWRLHGPTYISKSAAKNLSYRIDDKENIRTQTRQRLRPEKTANRRSGAGRSDHDLGPGPWRCRETCYLAGRVLLPRWEAFSPARLRLEPGVGAKQIRFRWRLGFSCAGVGVSLGIGPVIGQVLHTSSYPKQLGLHPMWKGKGLGINVGKWGSVSGQ